jgi:hypothetical protein
MRLNRSGHAFPGASTSTLRDVLLIGRTFPGASTSTLRDVLLIGRTFPGASTSTLRDVLLMKPGSTPADLYSVLLRPPYQLLEGEFVRAEARVLHQVC